LEKEKKENKFIISLIVTLLILVVAIFGIYILLDKVILTDKKIENINSTPSVTYKNENISQVQTLPPKKNDKIEIEINENIVTKIMN